MLDPVLSAYQLPPAHCSVQPFGSGLINRTWKISHGKSDYILQQINHHVFKQPRHIAANTRLLAGYLKKHYPAYLFVAPLYTHDKADLVETEDGHYFRLQPFVQGSRSHNTAPAPAMAFEAARQFGRFTRLLAGLPAEQLHITLPGFHDLSLRYRQFETALEKGLPLRIRQAEDSIGQAMAHRHIVSTFESIAGHPGFKRRITHHDTKISNVLFDQEGNGLCVIDLDTVMPGYFISDFGDMLRTYLSPADEEEPDLDKIIVREDYFRSVLNGYLAEMKDELTAVETAHLLYAGKYMIYMQALRFLTDFLNGDTYYGARYEGHNLVRARNQLCLLQQLHDKETILNRYI